MNRFRPMLAFVFAGGLLIFASPNFIYQATIKRPPWSGPLIVTPLYALLS
jgi:hypothetical protein